MRRPTLPALAALLLLAAASPLGAQPAAIATIRERWAAIERELPTDSVVRRDVLDASAEGGTVDAYYRRGELRKLSLEILGETGKSRRQVWFWGGRPFFVLAQDHRYDRPLSGRVVSTTTERFYLVDGGRLVRWLRGRRSLPVGGPEARRKEAELLEAIREYRVWAEEIP